MAYRAATGLEAVIGFLYLKGNEARVEALMEKVCAIAEDLERHPAQPERSSGPEVGGEESELPKTSGDTAPE